MKVGFPAGGTGLNHMVTQVDIRTTPYRNVDGNILAWHILQILLDLILVISIIQS